MLPIIFDLFTLINHNTHALQADGDHKLIKFFSIPARRDIKDLIADIGRLLDFTKSNYHDINGVFLEFTQNERYHAYLYSRDDNFASRLVTKASDTDNNKFKSLNINKHNIVFAVPPHHKAIYSIVDMEMDSAMKEKVIQFATGPTRTILDIMCIIDTKQYPIQYLVCNRANTFVAYVNGTDAILVAEKLRKLQIETLFSTSFAVIEYPEDEPVLEPMSQQRQQVSRNIQRNNSNGSSENNRRNPRSMRHQKTFRNYRPQRMEAREYHQAQQRQSTRQNWHNQNRNMPRYEQQVQQQSQRHSKRQRQFNGHHDQQWRQRQQDFDLRQPMVQQSINHYGQRQRRGGPKRNARNFRNIVHPSDYNVLFVPRECN
jgi:hypothetical protein